MFSLDFLVPPIRANPSLTPKSPHAVYPVILRIGSEDVSDVGSSCFWVARLAWHGKVLWQNAVDWAVEMGFDDPDESIGQKGPRSAPQSL